MRDSVKYTVNKASVAEILDHFLECDADFVPPLSGRVEMRDYARKIASKATRFEAWSGRTLVGLVAAYCNDLERRVAFITSVSVLKPWASKGIATYLVCRCIDHAKTLGMQRVDLEVARDNAPAISLYEKNEFVAGTAGTPFITMSRYFESGANDG